MCPVFFGKPHDVSGRESWKTAGTFSIKLNGEGYSSRMSNSVLSTADAVANNVFAHNLEPSKYN